MSELAALQRCSNLSRPARAVRGAPASDLPERRKTRRSGPVIATRPGMSPLSHRRAPRRFGVTTWALTASALVCSCREPLIGAPVGSTESHAVASTSTTTETPSVEPTVVSRTKLSTAPLAGFVLLPLDRVLYESADLARSSSPPPRELRDQGCGDIPMGLFRVGKDFGDVVSVDGPLSKEESTEGLCREPTPRSSLRSPPPRFEGAFVRRVDIVPVTTRAVAMDLSDGRAVRLSAGVALRIDGDRATPAFAGLSAASLSLPAAAVGLSYSHPDKRPELPPSSEEKPLVCTVEEPAQLGVSVGPSNPIVKREVPCHLAHAEAVALTQDGPLLDVGLSRHFTAKGATARAGNVALVTLESDCAALRVSIATPTFDAGACRAGIGLFPSSHRVPARARMFWPSGSPAGSLGEELLVGEAESKASGRSCFSVRVSGATITEAPLCFDAADVRKWP